MKESQVRVVIAPVHGRPFEAIVPNQLETFQSIVGGLIEYTSLALPDDTYLDVVFNEEGRLYGLPVNPNAPQLLGDLYVSKADGEGSQISLNNEEVALVMAFFADQRAMSGL